MTRISIQSVSITFAVAAAVAAAAPTIRGQSAGSTQPPLPQQAAPAAAAKPAAPPVVGFSRHKMTAGDVTGDGIAEAITYDSDSKALRVISYTGPAPIQTMGITLKDVPTAMITADLDGDGRAELIVGGGYGGYNPKEGPQTDVTIRIYKPRDKTDWSPVEIYRKPTERSEVTSLQVKDLDGDGKPEILFAYYASKYGVDLRVARHDSAAWTVSELATIRMGSSVDAGDVMGNGKAMVVVGRLYGDPPDAKTTAAIGDAFVLDGDTRIPLPVTRGVSAIAVGDLDGKAGDEIVVADGWHANYGKLARCRIAVISRQGTGWKYELIEDLDNHIRFEEIDLVDLNGDGKPEIVGRASRNGALGGSVRVYERAGTGWRGMTVAELAQAYGVGDFNGDKTRELVFGGQPPLPFSLGSQGPVWDESLGEALEPREVDPKSLLDKPAPALKASEWMGVEPHTLAALKGKVVMLDFWATWCKPCIEMYPEMREWVKEFGPEGFVVLGLTNHSRQTSAQVKRFHDRQKLPWAVGIDPKNGTHIDYGVSPIPHTFLIDRQGVVRLEHRGGGDLTKIKAKVQELLAEKPAGLK